MSQFTITSATETTVTLLDKTTGLSETVRLDKNPRASAKSLDSRKEIAGVPDIPSYRVWALGA